MKNLLLTMMFVFIFAGCSDGNDLSAPNVSPNAFLSVSESNNLEMNKWCEVTELTQKGKGCAEVQIRHEFTKYSDKEYLVQIRYEGGSVQCNNSTYTAQELRDLFAGGAYRVSFTAKHSATLTQVGAGTDEGVDVEFYVEVNKIKTIPVNKALMPNTLTVCKSKSI